MNGPLEVCPHCGYNLLPDKPIVLGQWTLTGDEVWFQGKRTKLTGQQAELVYAVAKGKGRPINRYALAARLGIPSAEDLNLNQISVLWFRVRKRLPNIPIESIRTRGLRWKMEAIGAA